jgi:hypothetical protein
VNDHVFVQIGNARCHNFMTQFCKIESVFVETTNLYMNKHRAVYSKVNIFYMQNCIIGSGGHIEVQSSLKSQFVIRATHQRNIFDKLLVIGLIAHEKIAK